MAHHKSKGKNRMKQYFMYGVLVSYDTYLNTKTIKTVDDLLNGNDDIHGIFTGRDGNFMLIGKVLKAVDDIKEPHIVPEIDELEMLSIEKLVNEKYGFHGDFHYFFIQETR